MLLMSVPTGSSWDWQVVGRDTASPGSTGRISLAPALLRFAATLDPKHADGYTAFADALDGRAPPARDGSYAFPRSDYHIHRRAGWVASWKGRSNRTLAARCVNEQAKLSADTGEGATFVYRADERGTGAHAGIWPLIDWTQARPLTTKPPALLAAHTRVACGAQYPGTTDEQGEALLAPCNWQFAYGRSPSFAGSVSGGGYGGAAQVLAPHNLTALRSWAFFDGGVASLVSNATLARGRRADANPRPRAQHFALVSALTGPCVRAAASRGEVFTTLANQNLAGHVVLGMRSSKTVACRGNASFALGGADGAAWVWHNFTGYLLLAGARRGGGDDVGRVHVEVGRRVGDYFRLSPEHRPAEVRAACRTVPDRSRRLSPVGSALLALCRATSSARRSSTPSTPTARSPPPEASSRCPTSRSPTCPRSRRRAAAWRWRRGRTRTCSSTARRASPC